MTYAKQTITSGIAIVRFEGNATPEVFNAPFTLVYKDGAVVSIGHGNPAPCDKDVEKEADEINGRNDHDAEWLERDVDVRAWGDSMLDSILGALRIHSYRGGIAMIRVVDDSAHTMAATYQAILKGETAPQWECASESITDTHTDARTRSKRLHERTWESAERYESARCAYIKRRDERISKIRESVQPTKQPPSGSTVALIVFITLMGAVLAFLLTK